MNDQVINILGYSGSHISLIFESLTSLSFEGGVRIIMHDEVKYFDLPFETTVNYEVVKHNELSDKPQGQFFFCSNNPKNKLFLFNFFKNLWGVSKEEFASISHRSAVIATTAKVKEGFYLEPLSVVSPYSKIGFGVSINRSCSIGHHNVIEEYSSIYPGSHTAGEVTIGKSVSVGPGSVLFSGVNIGDNTIIGGGSVVTKDIPSNVLAYGNPCRIIKDLPEHKSQSSLL